MPTTTSPNRGSEWRKWDLHVHTPASPLSHSFGADWNGYVGRLIDSARAHQVAAIATADYFTIEGYKKLLQFYDRGSHTLRVDGKTVSLCIIPGVELRLNIFNEQEDSINLHVFFDPSCSSDFITQNFLEQLQVTYRGSQVSLKSQNLLAIGKSISENTTLNLGEHFDGLNQATKDAYTKKALATVTLSHTNIGDALKAIDEIFAKQNLPQKPYLVAVVGKGHGAISSLKWFEDTKKFSRAGLIREHLTHQADIIFSNHPSDRQFYLGEHEGAPA
jgi:hypothetical protein